MLLCTCWSTASSQSSFGALTITVTDASSALIPGAVVTVTNISTGETKTATTSNSGECRFVDLIPANYRVTVQSASFKRFLQDNVPVQVGSTIRLDATLQAGEVGETVEVTAQPAMLQTESGSVSSEIEGAVVQAMPLNGRNAENLLSLVPGVVPGNFTSGSASYNGGNRTVNGAWGAYQIGGGFTNENVQLIDGAPTNMLQGNTVSLIPTQDSLQEFRVESNSPSAEFGRFGGGVVEMVTKSGTNRFHGTVYEYVRNTILNANDFFSNFAGLPKSPFHQNQYGVAVGGPIKREKAFFFFSWENFALRSATGISTNVPTAAQRAGVFNHFIFDPSGRCAIQAATPSPGQWTIPQSCFDPTSKVMLNYFPPPNSTVNPAYNYSVSPDTGDNTTQYDGRVDYNISSKQRIFARYTDWSLKDIGANLFHNYNGFPTGYAPTNNLTRAFVLGDTYTLNPNTIADLHLSYTREFYTNPAQGLNNVDISQFGPAYAALAPKLSYRALPTALFAGPDNLPNLLPLSLVQFDHYDNYGLSLGVAKLLGNHYLKFGGEGTLRLHNGTGNFHDPTGFSVYTPSSADELASFILGEFTTDAIQTVLPTTTFNYYWGFYANDTWKANRNLTLNFGLRYELPGGLAEKKDRDAVLLPNTTDPNTGFKGAITLVNSALWPSRSVEPYHYTLFSPRVSFAQSFDNGAAVLRGGYSLVYLPPDISTNLMSFNSPVNSAVTTAINGSTPTLFQSNPWPSGILQPTGRTNPTFSSGLLGQSVVVPVPQNSYPYMQQWNLAVGRQWKGNWTTQMIYAGTKGTHLPLNVPYGIDQVPTSATPMLQAMENSLESSGLSQATAAAQVTKYAQQLRPYPQFQNLQNAALYEGGSSYHALYLVLEKRFRSSGLINANYTWAKMLTNTDSAIGGTAGGSTGGGGLAQPQDFDNLHAEKSLASFDIAHRLLVNYVLNLPFGEGQPFARFGGVAGTLVSGWSVNGITTFQDGLPLYITYVSNNLTTNLGAGQLRPNYVPGCQKKTSGSSFQKFQKNNWFNAACFTYPGDFSFGNEPRVDPTLRSQGLVNFDFSLAKTTKVRDDMNLQFRAEAFDLFNHPYFNVPQTQMGGAHYDAISPTISSTSSPVTPRLLQLSLRLNF